jgi:hypothetical protein
MTIPQGFVLIHAVVRGNVFGIVLAPIGTENLPEEDRAAVWKVQIGLLDRSVAERHGYPAMEVHRVVQELFDYCVKEGLTVPLDRTEASEV